MSRPVVYLGGSISNDAEVFRWRKYVTSTLYDYDIVTADPCRDHSLEELQSNGLNTTGVMADGAFVARDLRDIRHCDALLVHWWGDPGRQSIGTFFEIGYAHALGIPIVVSDPTGELLQHPFITKTSAATYGSLDETIEYLGQLLGGTCPRILSSSTRMSHPASPSNDSSGWAN